jgi:hypothetical protein
LKHNWGNPVSWQLLGVSQSLASKHIGTEAKESLSEVVARERLMMI